MAKKPAKAQQAKRIDARTLKIPINVNAREKAILEACASSKGHLTASWARAALLEAAAASGFRLPPVVPVA